MNNVSLAFNIKLLKKAKELKPTLLTPVQEELETHLASMMKKVNAIKEATEEFADCMPDEILEEQLKHVMMFSKNAEKVN
jgi:hypothetical protein